MAWYRFLGWLAIYALAERLEQGQARPQNSRQAYKHVAVAAAKKEGQQLKDRLEQLSTQGNTTVPVEAGPASLLDELPGWLTAAPLDPMPVDDRVEDRKPAWAAMPPCLLDNPWQ